MSVLIFPSSTSKLSNLPVIFRGWQLGSKRVAVRRLAVGGPGRTLLVSRCLVSLLWRGEWVTLRSPVMEMLLLLSGVVVVGGGRVGGV